MENKITLEDIASRLDTLETTVASLTAEKNKGEPSGKFSHLGGIERIRGRSVETPEKPIDFSAIGGRVVRRASDHPTVKPIE